MIYHLRAKFGQALMDTVSAWGLGTVINTKAFDIFMNVNSTSMNGASLAALEAAEARAEDAHEKAKALDMELFQHQQKTAGEVQKRVSGELSPLVRPSLILPLPLLVLLVGPLDRHTIGPSIPHRCRMPCGSPSTQLISRVPSRGS